MAIRSKACQNCGERDQTKKPNGDVICNVCGHRVS
ncbi:endonuclease Q family protein [Polycladospora coralii]|nr:endonuclease Q family protein [Polycladospora coralii]